MVNPASVAIPIIEGVDIGFGEYHRASCFHEGKYAVFEKNGMFQMYGLLFAYDFEDVHRIGGYWYPTTIASVSYGEVPVWCYRSRNQADFLTSIPLDNFFDTTNTFVGGGFLVSNPREKRLETHHDESVRRVPEDILVASLLKTVEARVCDFNVLVSSVPRDPYQYLGCVRRHSFFRL